MTQEEFLKAATQLVQEFWESKYRPANLLNTEHNASTLAEGIWNFLNSSGSMPGIRDMKAILAILGDLDTGGKLQYHSAPKVIIQQVAPPPPPNPIHNLPHSDIKELNFLRTVEDVQRYEARVQKDGLDYMSGFKYLKAGSKPYEHINARIAFILKNEIHAPDSRETAPVQSKPVVNVPSAIADARAAVDSMTVGDVGQTGSSMGRRQLLANKQRRLHNDINEAWSKGVKPGVILERTKQAIREFGQGGIR